MSTVKGTVRRRSALGASAAGTAAVLLLAGCSAGPSPIHPPSVTSPPAAPGAPGPTGATGTPTAPDSGATPSAAPAKGTAKVTGTVATGIDTPWGLVQLPDGTLLVGSRDTGRISRVDMDKGTVTQIGGVPGVTHTQGGENGLLGLAVSPGYGSDHQVYAYYGTESDNRVVRMLYDPSRQKGEQLGAPDTILRDIPTGTLHNGGRIAFGPDGMLYVGTGETGQRGLAQDMTSPAGKILRMTPDGQVPQDNPVPGSLVYSPGHRNVQGLAWDPQGHLWASEFGQDTWDELNLIEPGRNYGWPVVEGIAHRAGYVDPVAQWHTDDASPSGIAYAAGSVWMAALKGERLWRVPLNGTATAAAPQSFFTGTYGRLRTVTALDDHTLLLTTSNTDNRGTPKKGDDRILRVSVT
ncbi:PQQ-dependent sugar dehydrogenase [Actinacidiphila sp. ITFR-21]|uniref:PQQ-dependent sugar dehydrogenase n=1 Tax=Actinacidiphila sp. ITFR-21 TaxID=3075199 RepID=UPI00288C5CFF|nr:PQQ-dependent sugar dehydrogenase [Streptomyces sp. ITFR-21]WNI18226.1 PQQ-dependent sugar dehydrogenase [Streptomyces sp. ITFR-21]